MWYIAGEESVTIYKICTGNYFYIFSIWHNCPGVLAGIGGENLDFQVPKPTWVALLIPGRARVRKTLAEGGSSPQELEESRRSGLYLLVSIIWYEDCRPLSVLCPSITLRVPPWNLKWAWLESSDQRLFTSIVKTKMISRFLFGGIFFLKKYS